jgi:hypothetical protein
MIDELYLSTSDIYCFKRYNRAFIKFIKEQRKLVFFKSNINKMIIGKEKRICSLNLL